MHVNTQGLSVNDRNYEIILLKSTLILTTYSPKVNTLENEELLHKFNLRHGQVYALKCLQTYASFKIWTVTSSSSQCFNHIVSTNSVFQVLLPRDIRDTSKKR